MAITAAMTVSSATCTAGQTVTATCTVTNSGASAVTVLGVMPIAPPHSATNGSTAVALGRPPLGPGMTTSVAGSNGTLALSWGVIPHAPASGEGWEEPASQVYDLGAIVYTSDGSVTAATTTTLTVSSPTH